MSNYRCISNFGASASNDPSNNPLSYCLLQTMDSEFLHGGTADSISGKYSRNCQAFMSQYCANKWDDVCEFASSDTSHIYPNNLQKCGSGSSVGCQGLTAGEVLVANTAARKYLVSMGGSCCLKYEPFDPTVASSPLISFWEGGCNTQGNGGCVAEYAVDPTTIDNDPVMQKILAKPIIAWTILVNIYNTARRKNKLEELRGTNIYNFFTSQPFQNYLKQMAKIPGIICTKGCCSGARSLGNITSMPCG